mmetsp:Transcript_26096/g.75247  ORF Transcript_26096/g.75247 Transcript_26096/m.75247 type:complete len:207 (-) Transcript_26096:118-738(-)
MRKLVPQLVASRAEAGESHVEASEVLRKLITCEHPYEVTEVVGARKGYPPRRPCVPADQLRGRQPLPKLLRIDPLRRMSREVNARSTEEGHRFRRVKVHVNIEAEVEGPYTSQRSAVARNGDPQLDGSQAVHILTENLISNCSCPGSGFLPKEARELDVKGKDNAARPGIGVRALQCRSQERVKCLVEVPGPDVMHLATQSLRGER